LLIIWEYNWGITYTNCSGSINNTAWFGNNTGTFEKFTGTFLYYKTRWFCEVNGAV
jgi:hypothetical protein